ncbi:hypothetical protein ACFCYN_20560 [Gottfriedia sp. NPDC056225]|uniref:hypothetical protein n=1 Tax=Gottfriedia sp. NPDC056225 TaxID=3345751 RepID=UPI0035DD744D
MAQIPFGAFLMDVFILLLIIIYCSRTFLKGLKKNKIFIEIIKSNYFMIFLLLFAFPIIRDVIHYLLNLK